MNLLTTKIINALPKLGATIDIPMEDRIVICKFFFAGSNLAWYVFEGEGTKNDDYLFFGIKNDYRKI